MPGMERLHVVSQRFSTLLQPSESTPKTDETSVRSWVCRRSVAEDFVPFYTLIALFGPALGVDTGLVYIGNSQTTGVADIEFLYGTSSGHIMAGDWDSDGDPEWIDRRVAGSTRLGPPELVGDPVHQSLVPAEVGWRARSSCGCRDGVRYTNGGGQHR